MQLKQPSGVYLEQLVREGRVKLEITSGVQTWRLLPTLRHQRIIDRIRASIAPLTGSPSGCGCYHVSDVLLRFPDHSFKRPDIAIFCVKPPDIDEAWEQVPEAVIEIISRDYEEKDLSINPPWYLAQGVRDVLVLDPRSHAVTHWSHGHPKVELRTPHAFELLCGCRVTIYDAGD